MKIALLGCKGTTYDLLNSINSEGLSLDCVITIPEPVAAKNKVAFYMGPEILELAGKLNIRTHILNSYHLKDAEDLDFFKNSGIDLLLVLGWERLVPEEILSLLGKFACGMHGSPFGLPRGRGRSPLNWSIITGHNKFLTYLFKYDPGTDSGPVIGFKLFDINRFDTIASLHSKNRIAMQQLVSTYLPLIKENRVNFWNQPPELPTYYPKRSESDSGIDWSRSTDEIYDLIRAVTSPYPPAYCFLQGKKILILEASPFDTLLFHDSRPAGTVTDLMLSLGQFVVKTRDGSLIVKKFQGLEIGELKTGDILEGLDQAKIIREITDRYPENISEEQREIK